MDAALIEVCVDPRLNHEVLRLQVRQKLDRSGIRVDRIYILNDVGGNVGANFMGTAQFLTDAGVPIVFCAVLHHDDCMAADAGKRADLAAGAGEMKARLTRLGVQCPVLTGTIRTEHSQVRWSDEPESRYVPFTFGSGMGQM